MLLPEEIQNHMKELQFYLKSGKKKKSCKSLGTTLHVHRVLISGRLRCQYYDAFPHGFVSSGFKYQAGTVTWRWRVGQFLSNTLIYATLAQNHRQPRSPYSPHSRSTLAFSANSMTSSEQTQTFRLPPPRRSSPHVLREGPRTAAPRDPRAPPPPGAGAGAPSPPGRYITQRGAVRARPPPLAERRWRRGLGVSGAPAARPRRLGGPGEAPRSHTHTHSHTHRVM